ncbi:MAG: C4-type zinc ribbon domain-containing protein [Thermodesulfobacteriota bacterium]|nr:C4-type zinc ribbon domain-containing protein [Thermodesulfobacteriota bacterium]
MKPIPFVMGLNGEVGKLEVSMKNLIGLQDCDIRIVRIRIKKEEGPAKIQVLQAGLEVMERRSEAELAQLEESKKQRRKIEQDVKDIDGGIKKSEAKLSTIKSNKEYQAALKEIDDLNKGKLLLEDQVIEFMEELEELEKRCADTKTEGVRLKHEFETDREAILKEMKALDKELQTLERERSRLCRSTDDDLLKRYNFLKERKNGLAVSPVINGVCQTCHMDIPAQKFNELIRGDMFMTCPHCKRIIYWGEDERFV